jgi:hypothetical protein
VNSSRGVTWWKWGSMGCFCHASRRTATDPACQAHMPMALIRNKGGCTAGCSRSRQDTRTARVSVGSVRKRTLKQQRALDLHVTTCLSGHRAARGTLRGVGLFLLALACCASLLLQQAKPSCPACTFL